MTARLPSFTIPMLAACLALQGCGAAPGQPKPGPEVPRPDAILDFPTLYQQNCAGCHGAKGMDGPSYPLANPEYQALVDESVLRDVIAHGRHGALMPAFAISAGGTLTGDQVEVLVAGMRTAWYNPHALAGEHAPPYRSSAAPNVAAGQQVYSTYCASCHGENKTVGAPPARPGKAGSITDPDFLALLSDQALRTVIVAGRPDIGQPDWKSYLPQQAMSDQQVTDVVAWLASQRPNAEGHVAPGPGSPASQSPAPGKLSSTKKSGRGLQ